jgi:glyceraldehyde-3-phosphate dehydrogenase (NADP+)
MIVMDSVREELISLMKPKIESLSAGNQLDESTGMGPLVRESDAGRVENWIQEAVSEGARLVCGGQRDGAIMQPTLLDGANHSMKVCREELFGPAVSVVSANNTDDAIRLANDTEFGLGAGVFTQDIDTAMRFAREVDSGNIHINWGPMWRVDAMPYGGLKGSGTGKEGPKYAIEEMTEMKTVVIHSK